MDELIQRLRGPDVTRLLQTHRVQMAFLFGSRARGQERPGSDLDFAILLPEDHDPVVRLESADALRHELERLLPHRVEVVVLNDASIPLRFEAEIRGVTVLAPSVEDAFRYENRVRMQFEDFEHIQSFFVRAYRQRLGLEP